MGGMSTIATVLWIVWLALASALMIKAPTLGGYVLSRKEQKYDRIDEEELGERKVSSDESRNDSFSVGEWLYFENNIEISSI